MNIDDIRSKAPQGATHYDNDLKYYYADGWFLYVWNGCDWSIFDMYPDVRNLNPLN